jgi:hypothetical protein
MTCFILRVPDWFLEFVKDEALRNALGAAIGGFLGVILFFLVRLIIEKIRARPKLIRLYPCGNEQNIGNPQEYEGQLMHHHGTRLTEPNELKRIGKSAPIWEWNKTPCGRGQGSSVIYGPYTTDFSEPGEYEVSFEVRALGISKRSDLNHDPIILEFDITRTTPMYAATAAGVQYFNPPITVSKHFVRASDLARNRWVAVPVRFYATGEGVWEYRIHAYDGVSKPQDHIGHLGQDVRLFFDKISISQIRKMVLPWG